MNPSHSPVLRCASLFAPRRCHLHLSCNKSHTDVNTILNSTPAVAHVQLNISQCPSIEAIHCENAITFFSDKENIQQTFKHLCAAIVYTIYRDICMHISDVWFVRAFSTDKILLAKFRVRMWNVATLCNIRYCQFIMYCDTMLRLISTVGWFTCLARIMCYDLLSVSLSMSLCLSVTGRCSAETAWQSMT